MAILNREYLSEMTGGDIQIDAQLYEVFVASTSDYLDQIKAAQTPEERKKAIHRLKGAAANVGAEDLADACRQGEEVAFEENEEKWVVAALAIFEAYKKVALEMMRFIRSAKTQG